VSVCGEDGGKIGEWSVVDVGPWACDLIKRRSGRDPQFHDIAVISAMEDDMREGIGDMVDIEHQDSHYLYMLLGTTGCIGYVACISPQCRYRIALLMWSPTCLDFGWIATGFRCFARRTRGARERNIILGS
jgi:hypothetical protein